MQLVIPKLEKHSNLGVSFYTDDALFEQTGVKIAFTGRVGGVSGNAGELNLAGHVDDDPASVCKNRARVLDALDIRGNVAIATVNQVHGNDVVVLSDALVDSCKADGRETGIRNVSGYGVDVRGVDVCSVDVCGVDVCDVDVCSANVCGANICDADGIIVPADVNDVVAMMFYADCMPVAIVAPSGNFALVHAGWRGVFNRIVLSAIEKLCNLDASLEVSECNVYIGPHIHKECFEVSAELAQEFAGEFGKEVLSGERNVSLVAAMRKTLVCAGVSEQRICDIDICTACHTDEFFSYRAESGTCGRHSLVGTGLFRRQSRIGDGANS